MVKDSLFTTAPFSRSSAMGRFRNVRLSHLPQRHRVGIRLFGLPIVKLSPWWYPYDSAFMVRHDFENDTGLISSIEASAQFEASVGAKGDYYFTSGAIRGSAS